MTARNQVAEGNAKSKYLDEVSGQTVPAGYKQTEVGVIPEDWGVYSISEVVKRTQLGGNYGNSESETDYPLIKMGNLDRGSIKLDKLEYVTSTPHKNDLLQYGDVLFNTRNTLELVGKIAIWRDELPQAYFNSNLMRLTFNEKLVASGFYMNAVMNTKCFITALAGIATGTTSVAAIYTRDLFTLKIGLARKEEQTPIANVLSDVDMLINESEKLIAKKQAIKTAAMQQLLTGRTRLCQFSLRKDGTKKGYKQSEQGEIPEDWDVKCIGDFTDCTAGGTPSTSILSYWGGENPWMSSGELHLKRIYDVAERITDEGLAKSSTKYVPENSVLMGLAGQGKTRGTVAISKILLCTNQSIAAIFPSAKHSTDYVYYNLDQRYEQLRGLSTGDGGRGGLNLTIIRNLLIPLPSIEEQTAIAAILSDMDTEIKTLQQRLTKTRQIKQGMMQELLTGKTRLIKPQPSYSANDRKEYAHE